MGEIIPSCFTPARMRRLVDMAVSKDASNVRPFRYKDMVYDKARGKIKNCEFVGETFDPYSIEGLRHIQGKCACYSLLFKIPGLYFYKVSESSAVPCWF
jgi:hypothetical protein